MSARDVLSLAPLSASQMQSLLALAARLKQAGHRPQTAGQPLRGRVLALLFQKPSMRTRVAFEVGMSQLGGATTYLGPDDLQLGVREPVKDIARVLARYVDAIVARTFAHADVEELARYADVPVINGLSDLHHPCQALADLLTIQEAHGRLRGLTLGFVGDGNNVLHSLLEAASKVGLHVQVAVPKGYEPDRTIWTAAVREAKRSGARLTLTHDPRAAARGADALYTDVWTSMGQERERRRRLRVFRGFQINAALLRLAAPGCRVLHCLPAHRGEEITDEAMEGPQSSVFDQAENRLHTHKAILLQVLKGR